MSARARFGRSGIEASSHVAPLSLVILISPLLVPTQMIPAETLDADMDSMALRFGGVARVVSFVSGRGFRARCGLSPLGYVRSGLIFFHVTPPFVEAATNWNAASNSCLFTGENMTGCELVVRPCSPGSADGLTLIHCSLGYVIFTIPEPLAYTIFGLSGSGTMVPHSQPGTGLQSSGVISPRLPRLRVLMAPASC